MDFVARKVHRLIVFLGKAGSRGEHPGRGKGGIFVDNCAGSNAVRVLVELRAQELVKLRPRRKRGGRGVAGDETFAVVMHELQEVGFLLVVEGDLAVTEEKDGVDVGEAGTAAGRLPGGHQRVVGNDVGIGAYPGVVETGLVADTFDGCESVSDGFVLCDAVAGIGPGEDGFSS